MNLYGFCQKTVILLIVLSIIQCPSSSAAQQPALKKTAFPAVSGTSNATDVQPPSAPLGLTVTHKTHTSISLGWSESSDNVEVKGYQVYRDGRKIITTSKTSFTNMNLIPGKQYMYAVKAYDAKGNVSESGTAITASTFSDSQPPSPPGAPGVSSVAFTYITLSWLPSSDDIGVKGYEIYVNGTKKAAVKTTNYTFKGLSPGKTFSFHIKAFDAAGNYSSASPISAGTVADMSAPSIPGGLKAENITETGATLVWLPSTDNVKVKGYEIYSDGKKVGSSGKAFWQCKGLLPGNIKTFSIRAVDVSGLKSSESTPLTFSTLKDQKNPTIPANLKIASSRGSTLSLSWDPSTDNTKVKGYKLYCNGFFVDSTTRTTKSVKISNGFSASIFWVRAYDLADNLSEKSNAVTAVTLK